MHIADSPCHGMRYHGGSVDDSYPFADQVGDIAEVLMNEIEAKKILYYFGGSNTTTDKMIDVFNSSLSYGMKIKKFDISRSTDMTEKVLRSVVEAIEETKQTLLNKEVCSFMRA